MLENSSDKLEDKQTNEAKSFWSKTRDQGKPNRKAEWISNIKKKIFQAPVVSIQLESQ